MTIINLPALKRACTSAIIWRWIPIVLSVVSCSFSPVESMAAITTVQVDIYSGPHVDYPVIAAMDSGTGIVLIGRQGDTWMAFKYKNEIGWVQEFFLDIDGNSKRLPQLEAIEPSISTDLTEAIEPSVEPALSMPEQWKRDFSNLILNELEERTQAYRDNVLIEVGEEHGGYINFYVKMLNYESPGEVEGVPKYLDGDQARTLLSITYDAIQTDVVPPGYEPNEVWFMFLSELPRSLDEEDVLLESTAYWCPFFWDEVKESALLTTPFGEFAEPADNITVFWDMFFSLPARCTISRLYQGIT